MSDVTTAELGRRVNALEGSQEDLEKRMGVLEGDMKEIRAELAQTATKTGLSDVERRLSSMFQTAHVDLLKDAYNSLPAKWSAIFGGLMVLIMVVQLAVLYTQHH